MRRQHESQRIPFELNTSSSVYSMSFKAFMLLRVFYIDVNIAFEFYTVVSVCLMSLSLQRTFNRLTYNLVYICSSFVSDIFLPTVVWQGWQGCVSIWCLHIDSSNDRPLGHNGRAFRLIANAHSVTSDLRGCICSLLLNLPFYAISCSRRWQSRRQGWQGR